MQISKSIVRILLMIAISVTAGVGVCRAVGVSVHIFDASVAACIGLAGAIAGLLPLQLRVDRTPATLFQSAWLGSILHMAVAAAMGLTALYFLKLSTPFVIWLLAMYWISLIALSVALVKALQRIGRSVGPSDKSGPTQQVTFA